MNSEIKVLPMQKCKSCESIELIRVGFNVIEGWLCKSCNTYSGTEFSKRAKNKTRKIKWVKNFQTNQIFENDLSFEGGC